MTTDATISTIAERALRRLGVSVVPLDDAPVFTEMVPTSVLATMALVELGVIAADELPAPSDQALMEDKIKSVHAGLDAQGLVWWSGASGHPRAFVEEYVKIASAQAASSFGKTGDPQMVLLNEQRIRRGVMRFSAHDIAVEAVMAVHTNLTSRGIARWTVFDLPQAVELPYEQLAAQILAPKFEKQADPAELVQATRAINQFVSLGTSGERVRAEYF